MNLEKDMLYANSCLLYAVMLIEPNLCTLQNSTYCEIRIRTDIEDVSRRPHSEVATNNVPRHYLGQQITESITWVTKPLMREMILYSWCVTVVLCSSFEPFRDWIFTWAPSLLGNSSGFKVLACCRLQALCVCRPLCYACYRNGLFRIKLTSWPILG